ncbi:MAG: hypothetical protein JSR37_10115 [Verrucomicrobia bacterium]|nr:hypothetical protein [Verrucomicrobiota bacterium]
MQVSEQPVLFFRAARACVHLVGHWVPLSDIATKQCRAVRLFSAAHGFFGAARINEEMHLWVLVNHIRKYVSSIAWFCKSAADYGYISPESVAWTVFVSKMRYPAACISLYYGVKKVYTLLGDSQSSTVLVTKQIFYCTTKMLIVISPINPFVSLNLAALVAIRVLNLYFATICTKPK